MKNKKLTPADRKLKERNVEEKKIVLRKILALALLPADNIEEAFNELRSNLTPDLKELYAGFLSYYEDYWLKQRGPQDFCVHREFVRTNNSAESNNSRLSHKLPRTPSCSTFVSKKFVNFFPPSLNIRQFTIPFEVSVYLQVCGLVLVPKK